MRKYIDYFKFVRKTSRLPEYRCLFCQFFEMVVVFTTRGIGPGYYLMAEMGKKQYDWDYKLGFLNGRQYVRRIDKINEPKYYPATFNKLIEKALLTQYSIPTPKLLGYLNLERGHSCEGKNLKTVEDFAVFIGEIEVKKVCFKLISGSGGFGFRLVEVIRVGGVTSLRDVQNQQLFSIDEFFAALGISDAGEYLVEEYLEQHPDMKRLNPSSVNTLRVMVYQRSSSERPQCLGVHVRIGRRGSVIDNGSAGGISAKVDIANGILSAATLASSRVCSFQSHPDSGAQIEGTKIPLLAEAIALAINAIEVFPGMKYSVFDVAIGIKEPVIIELNCKADYVDFAELNLPSRLALS